ncbi:MAG: hypothetical protein IJ799_02160 [Bacteroidales bacterium]|nr:hypothetical protein [Bacteroidales bacterium]
MDTNSFFRMSFLAAAAIVAASCSSARSLSSSSGRVRNRYVSAEAKYNEEWRGRSHADIVLAFGAPDREVSDGADGYILVYEKITQDVRVSEDLIHVGSSRSYSTSTSYDKSYIHFYIGGDRLCYNVKTNKMVWTGGKNPWKVVEKAITWTSIAAGAAILIGMISSASQPMPSLGF